MSFQTIKNTSKTCYFGCVPTNIYPAPLKRALKTCSKPPQKRVFWWPLKQCLYKGHLLTGPCTNHDQIIVSGPKNHSKTPKNTSKMTSKSHLQAYLYLYPRETGHSRVILGHLDAILSVLWTPCWNSPSSYGMQRMILIYKMTSKSSF